MPKPTAPQINAIERYLRARESMENTGTPIPHHVLRAYLDVIAIARREATGLHNVTITVTKVPIKGMLDWNIMLETGTEIRVEGARWTHDLR